ncbi:hypothetical protein GCM10010919_15190 [Alishewanella longhuensis]|uniref:Serine/threonine protein kinase n=1 Tax=Alishewanella longhuensis TaxID=1091037 RepID=A0ABQ3KZ65_9ALTE|nr:hypothetical protein [Alishewanella longhuensis]GHG66929.1 hypothetical protein GCM10010919_15190 [Alishewanella longhuensis]
MTDQTLANYIDSLRSIRQERSFSILWQDNKVWVKQQEHAAPKWLQLASHAIAALSSNPLYFPSAESGAPLEREAVRLKLMHVKGFRVPEVLLATPNYLVLSDVGPSLKYWLTKSTISVNERRHILLEAAAALAQLHQNRYWHGRPALRDLCWDGKQIGFIDFEEDPHQMLSIDQCMVRDLLIFVHGLYRYLPTTDPLIVEVINEYRRLAPERVWREGIKTVEQMWLIYPVLELSHNLLGKDGKQAVMALRQLRQYQSRSKRSKLPWLLISAALAYALADQFD